MTAGSGLRVNEAIAGDGAIDIDDMTSGAVHGGNERLPVSRPEHVNHTGRGEGD